MGNEGGNGKTFGGKNGAKGKGKDNEGGNSNTFGGKNGAKGKGKDNEGGNGKSVGGKNGAKGKGKDNEGGNGPKGKENEGGNGSKGKYNDNEDGNGKTFGAKNVVKGGKGGLIIPLIDDTDCAHLVKNLDHEGITSDLAYQMVMEDFPWMDDEESEVQNTFWPNQNNAGILVPK